MPSYQELIQSQSQNTPYLSGLLAHLADRTGASSTIIAIDYPRGDASAPIVHTVSDTQLAQAIQDTPTLYGRVLLIENIQSHATALLGEALDVDPLFFASYITTDFPDIEIAPPPPSLALFPSQIAEKGHLHLHYQQVLDLGSSDTFPSTSYGLHSNASTPRNVRRLPPLSGRQLAIARACCSLLVQKLQNSWICLVLVDPPVRKVFEKARLGSGKVYPSQLLHGGSTYLSQLDSFSSFQSGMSGRQINSRSMLNYLLQAFTKSRPGFIAADPTVLSIGYYPIRAVLADWNIYTHLLSRYVKYYEYTLNDIENRMHNNDIIDLQRWRRRSTQSLYKLMLLAEFITYWHPKEQAAVDSQPWELVRRDIEYIQSQLKHYNHFLEQMIPMGTSMVQLLDSRRMISEATSVSRLTFTALVFVPLSWVASLFSMSDGYAPGQQHFWVYFAIAVPTLLLAVLLSTYRWGRLAQRLRASWTLGMVKLGLG